MPYHALDVTLTRALTPAELRQAARTMPLAANHDATRLLAVVHAKTPDKAFSRLRRRAGGQLPVDVITTHYPDPRGQIMLNVVFPPAAHAALEAASDRAGLPLPLFVQEAVHLAVARHADEEADRLERAVQHLLTGTTPSHLLDAVGRALTRTPGAARC